MQSFCIRSTRDLTREEMSICSPKKAFELNKQNGAFWGQIMYLSVVYNIVFTKINFRYL